MKKVLAVIMAIFLISSYASVTTFAGTVAEDYGLTSSNAQVQITDDGVAVFSHPSDGRYYVSSETLVAALTAADGYTIAYVDANKEAKAVTSVTEGFVKLSKDGQEDVYVPVSARGKTLDDRFKDSTYFQDSGWSYHSGDATLNYDHRSLGGKSADAYAYSMTAGETPISSFTRLERGVPGTYHTYEFNVYADGDASARINYMYSDDKYGLLIFSNDGKIYYNLDGVFTEGPSYVKGTWNKVALTLDKPRGRYLMYVNGVRLTDKSPYTSTPQKLMFGMSAGSANGMVAYSDLDAYYGYYYADEAFAPVSTDDMVFDNEAKVIKYDEYKYTNADEMVAKLAEITDATYVGAFEDDSFTAPAVEISDDTVIVFEDADKCYIYYTTEPFGDDFVPSTTELGITSNNSQVMVTEDAIGVFSNNFSGHSSYFVSSAALVEALSSTAGYSFEYVDVNKEPAEVAAVTEGYVYAYKDGARSAYYPITKRIDFTAPSPYRSKESNVTVNLSAPSGAGKDASETCESWSTSSGITRPNRAEWKLFTTPDNAHSAPTVYTVVFNIRADGDAVPAIYYRYSDFPVNGKEAQYLLFKWNPDGEVIYHIGDQNDAAYWEHVSAGKLDRSKWQQVAITYDFPRGRFHIYINGKLMTETSCYINRFNTAGSIRYGITAPTTNGTAYFDDLETYYGYYYPEYYAVNAKVADTVALRRDKNVVYYDADKITDVASLAQAIVDGTDASQVKVFADATLTTPATAIDENTVVVTVSSNGKKVDYYKPVADVKGAKSFEFKHYGQYVYANADLGLASGDDNAKVIILRYNKDNTLGYLNIVDVVDSGVENQVKLSYSPTSTYKAFFWGENLAPLCEVQEISSAQ